MAYAESDLEGQAWVAAFREGLKKLGWAEGSNIRIDYRWGAVDVDLMQRFARELVALQPDVIFTQNTPTTALVLQQTRTIPSFSRTLPIRSAAASSRARRPDRTGA